tara:strand:+ start:12016 stop:13110 length:1095 start_codon:yes stop_codon:yes gene_type:complete
MNTDDISGPINVEEFEDLGGEDFTLGGGENPFNQTQEEDKFELDENGDQVLDEAGEPIKVTFDPSTGDLLDEVKLKDVDVSNPDAVMYQGVAEILKGRGFFAGEEEIKIESEEDLASAFDKEVQSRLTDRQKEILDYKNQGVNINEIDRIQSAIDNTAQITEESLISNEELAMQVVVSEFNHKGLDGAEYAELFKANGTLGKEAFKLLGSRNENLNSMLTAEKTRAADGVKAEKDAESKRISDFNTALERKEVLGRKLNDGTVTKLKNLVNTPVAYTPSGEPMNQLMKFKEENPIDFEHTLSYLYLVTDGFKNLKAFDRNAESRVSRQFRDAVSTISASPDISRPASQKSNSNVIDMNTVDDLI